MYLNILNSYNRDFAARDTRKWVETNFSLLVNILTDEKNQTQE